MTISDRMVTSAGTGNIGGILAADFAAGGQDFLLASRVPGVWLDAFEQLMAQ